MSLIKIKEIIPKKLKKNIKKLLKDSKPTSKTSESLRKYKKKLSGEIPVFKTLYASGAGITHIYLYIKFLINPRITLNKTKINISLIKNLYLPLKSLKYIKINNTIKIKIIMNHV